MITTSVIRLSLLAVLVATLAASVNADVTNGLPSHHKLRSTNAERLARGLPPNPPVRRRPGAGRRDNSPSGIPVAPTTVTSSDPSAPTGTLSTCARGPYIVQPGDFCNTISAANNVSLFQLENANPEIDPVCDNLQPGESICLALPGQDCTDLYAAVEGDGCFSIATQFGISQDTLEANNGGPNFCSTIQIGQEICVASIVIPYS